MPRKKLKVQALCCERFRESYEQGEISYAYESTHDIDETEWYVNGFHHLYFCPFCGAFIKGHGYGSYERTYPPAEGVKIFRQRKEEA
jgi:hypothetical protein